MLAKFFQHFLKFPKMVVLMTILITLFMTYQAGSKLFSPQGGLIIDNTIEPFMAHGSKSYEFFKEVEGKYSKSSSLIVALEPKKSNYNLDFFNDLEALSKELEAVSGVESVNSILNLPNPKGACSGKSYFHVEAAGSNCVSQIAQANDKLSCIGSTDFVAAPTESEDEDLDEDFDLAGDEEEVLASDDEGLDDEGLDEDFDLNDDSDTVVAESEPEAFICTASIAGLNRDDFIKETNDKLKLVMANIAKDPFIQKDLISKDHKKIASMINFKSDAKSSGKLIQEAVAAVIQKYQDKGIFIAYAGQTRNQYQTAKLLSHDMTTILPLSLFLMAMTLLLSFKSGRGVAVPFSIVSIGIVWTFGFFALLGDELNLVSMILPPLLVSVGSAYIIHVLNHYYHETENEDNMRQVMAKTLHHTAVPMVVTAFTTLSGFAALMLSPIPAIKQMGFYASSGIISVVILSLVFAPALLQLLPKPKKKALKKEETETKPTIVDKFLSYKSKLVGRFSLQFIVLWIIVVIVALTGTFNLSFSSGGSTFRETLPVAKDLKFIENNFAGTSIISVILSGDKLKTAQNILDIDTIKKYILDPKGDVAAIKALTVDKIYSPVEYLDYHRQGLDGLKDKEVENFFADLKKYNGPNFLSEDEKMMRFNIRMTIASSSGFLVLKPLLQAELDKHFKGVKVELTGGAILTSESEDNIARGQVDSILMALGIIFVVLSILFFSFKMGFLALYPNIAAIGLFFGILGWFGIPISVTISVIAAIALGIGVDDTIHFLSHYNMEIRKTRDEKEASLSTLRMIGRPMIFTTVTLTLGFVVFAMSDMQSQVLFGLFTALTLFICLITDLNFLPSIMARTKVITLWDYLDLNYSEEFLKKISIFRDMSPKEAKLTTLMAYTSTFEKDECIFSEGDVSNEMFIVLEGSVDIYLDASKHSQEHHLANFGQNAVFGEMGLLRDATRSASARALEETTLLVFNKKVLHSIRKRYPKISKKLFLNISRKLLLSLVKSNLIMEEEHDFTRVTTKREDTDHSIFKNISERDKAWLLKHAEIKELQEDEKLFTIGETGDFMAVILNGECKLTVDENDEHKVDDLTAGDIVGYSLIISDQSRRNTTVTATTKSEVVLISQDIYNEIMQNKHKLASLFNYNMVCLLSDRLEHNNATLHHN
jgi:uncharacterized protein